MGSSPSQQRFAYQSALASRNKRADTREVSSEFERIGLIEAILTRPSGNVAVGIGDDCAVLHPSPYPRVWTVDTAVEGVHFARSLMGLEQAAYRAFMAAASDLAAMGARPVGALSALTLPAMFPDAELEQLARGFARAADLCGCPVIGGNLARADVLTLTTTVLGECARPLLRTGARAGDGLYVSGTVGGAALGLRALQAGVVAPDDIVARFREPRARLDIAELVAELASAAIDISDGLAQDLGHLCRASGVGARVDAARLPLAPGALELAHTLGCDAVDCALTGGEDYELLFTAGGPVDPALATRIGTLTEERTLLLVEAHGVRPLLGGFDHFAGS
jgi:thiamine-monophosphate kinase